MNLINRDEFIDDMKELYSDHGFDSRELHFSLLDLINNLDCKEYLVEAIPVKWIEGHISEIGDDATIAEAYNLLIEIWRAEEEETEWI